MKICLTDEQEWNRLLPLTYTRSVADIRVGILTIREKWEMILGEKVYVEAPDYLAGRYEGVPKGEKVIRVNSAIIPDEHFVERVRVLQPGQAIEGNHGLMAWVDGNDDVLLSAPFSGEIRLRHPWDIFMLNGLALERDFELITAGRTSQAISATNTVIGKGKIFLEEGAKVEACIINAHEGPVYIGKNAEVMEGSVIRGGLALCEGAVLKMSAKIYGATTIGPYCKVGGEINNSVFLGYSNKAHDGFLGNSVIGEWCNLGADTNNSNLKNNYGTVKVFSISENAFISTGIQFCGLIMGDHSKSGINTMFNTGTVVGVNANVFGGGFPPKHIPSFSWGGADGFSTFDLDRSFDVSERVMSRRNLPFTDSDRDMMRHIFQLSSRFRG